MPQFITDEQELYIIREINALRQAILERDEYIQKLDKKACEVIDERNVEILRLQNDKTTQAKYIKDLEDALAEAHLMSKAD